MENILNNLGTEKNAGNKKWTHKHIYLMQYIFFYLISVGLLIMNFIMLPEKSNKNNINLFSIFMWVCILVSLVSIASFAIFVNHGINKEMSNLIMDNKSTEQIKLIEEMAKKINVRRNIIWGISLIPIIPIAINSKKKSS